MGIRKINRNGNNLNSVNGNNLNSVNGNNLNSLNGNKEEKQTAVITYR